MKKNKAKEFFHAVKADSLKFTCLEDYVKPLRYKVNQQKLDDSGWSLASETETALLEKLREKGIPLGEYVNGKIYRGVLTGLNEAFVISAEKRAELIAEDTKSAELIKPFLIGRDIKRYCYLQADKFIILIPKGWTNQKSKFSSKSWQWLKVNYPAIADHLLPFREKAEKRYDKGEFWWELRTCDYYDQFEKIKLIYPNICKKPEFIYDNEFRYTNQKCFIISIDDKYLLGILNSRVNYFLFNLILPKLRGGFFEPSYVFFKYFPIRKIDDKNENDKSYKEKIINLVDQMLELHKKHASAHDPRTRELLQRQIDATDRQIDQLVYKLYDLTEEEIGVVEGSG